MVASWFDCRLNNSAFSVNQIISHVYGSKGFCWQKPNIDECNNQTLRSLYYYTYNKELGCLETADGLAATKVTTSDILIKINSLHHT